MFSRSRFAPKSFKPIPAFRRIRNQYQRGQSAFFSGSSFPGILNVVDAEFQQAFALLKNERLTRRVLRLKRQNPNGTLPELVAMDWLNAQQFRYEFQYPLYGGRTARAGEGVIPDFVIFEGAGPDAWLIQGDYWHSRVEQRSRDAVALAKITKAFANGVPINRVMEIWESDIYDHNPTVFELAMQGIPWRQ